MTPGHNRPPMPAGWIAVHRTIRTHRVVGFGKPVKPCDPTLDAYSRSEAWQDLLMECRYQDGTVLNGGREMELRRGELVGAVSYLAQRWNWTPKTVRHFLDQLETEGMVSLRKPGVERGMQKGLQEGKQEGEQRGLQKGKQATVISVCNYDKYQSTPIDEGQANGLADGRALGTERGTQKGDIQTRDNKDNNIPPYRTDTRSQAEKDEADRLHREAYEKGLRIKGGATAKSTRPEIKARGGLDGSQGLLLDSEGRLQFVNGVGQAIADALTAEFPGINLNAVCNRAAAEIVKSGWVDTLQAKVILRRHAQYVLEDLQKRPAKSLETPDQRRKRLQAEAEADLQRGRK